jgi:two-component sensor histidine kinase
LKPWADKVAAQLGLPAERIREIKALGKDLLRTTQAAFAAQAETITADSRDETSAAHDRLRKLTGIAHRLRSQSQSSQTSASA